LFSTGSSNVGTPFQQLLHSLHHDQRWLTEVNLGKRVGFYRFRGELGSGNFSQVKMAVHQLTKGKSKIDYALPLIIQKFFFLLNYSLTIFLLFKQGWIQVLWGLKFVQFLGPLEGKDYNITYTKLGTKVNIYLFGMSK
jgi:hypothetical protein